MTYHYHLQWWWVQLEAPAGGNPKLPATEFWRLPFLRLFVAGGHAQVSVFFVLSGFVLSYRALHLLQSGQGTELFTLLSSAALRRWLRLYLPCLAVGLWAVIEVQAGIGKVPVTAESNILLQLWHFLVRFEDWSQFISIDRSEMGYFFPYHGTMWTLPHEFKGSVLVFVMVLGVARIRDYGRRTLVIATVTLYAMYKVYWTYWLFASGVLLADYVRHSGGFAELTRTTSKPLQTTLQVLLVLALYLAGVPSVSDAYTQTGYTFLGPLTPSGWDKIEGGGRWWWCWAGLLFIFSASHMDGVRQFFELPVCRYLGRISFMLYLTHFFVYHLIGEKTRAFISGLLLMPRSHSDLLGTDVWEGGALRSTIRDLLVWAVLGPIAIFVANWTETYVDRPSVEFAKWVDNSFVNGLDGSRAAAKEESRTQAPIERL